ncbi:uncharacterized protein BYT42DRAFT_19640 [Radiomyces spectabilis]|uniref:uncharacterized protein n=1 Tax=Radiomyces spectabilis TaxID=64574 RepID=UPI002220A774|nr:uncharacterized protein BYT42DRAFT_19640 [Radiomyces spectabilis]KAI8393819.1 hypothetical protein BYT42DRAFT_19640 [Radiomyces spectabilis]
MEKYYHGQQYNTAAQPGYGQGQYDSYAMHYLPPQQGYSVNHPDEYSDHYNRSGSTPVPTPSNDNGYVVDNSADRSHIVGMAMPSDGGYRNFEKAAYVPIDGAGSIRQRRSCIDMFCCGCCTCCPRWMRWCTCLILIIIVGLGIAVGVLAAIFKVPEVKFQGIEGQPAVSLNGTSLNMMMNFSISVNNPNIESITFETIEATAFYPGHHDIPLGGGTKKDLHIRSNGVTNFTFPFEVKVDAQQSASKSIAADILTKCGLVGGERQDLTIDYDVKPTVRIVGIPISITLSNKASFPCPIDGNDVFSILDKLLPLIPPDLLPNNGS